MAMSGEQSAGSRRSLAFGLVVLLHAGLVYVLANGLGEPAVKAVAIPVILDLIEETQTPSQTPPLPPPAMEPPPQVHVPAPEINVALPPPPAESSAISKESSAIGNMQSDVTASPPPRTSDTPSPDPAHPNQKPQYPAASHRLGEEGNVTLLLYVDGSGDVTDARVDKSSGYPRLDKAAARQAIKAWRFKPVVVAGKPAGTWFRYVVKWRLDEQ